MAWTIERLVRTAGIEAELRGDADVSELSYDSRQVAPGDLFCCIPGDVTDGHDHAPASVAAGARALLVERFLDVDVPQARVGSVRGVLGVLADAFFDHPSAAMRVAAVTGTNGKTTTTYLLESIVSASGLVGGVVGNVSRRYAGVVEESTRNTPESIDVQRLFRRMADADVDVVAVEATSDGLAAGRLRGTRFASAGFTNLTQDHLNTHGTMEAYFEAKALLFDPSYTSRAVINIDDAYGRELADRTRSTLEVLTYGEHGDIAAESVELRADGSRALLRTPNGTVDIVTTLVGRYNISNCMCAIGLAMQCGIPIETAVAGIAALARVPGRLDSVDAGQPFLALVDYAHTPDALEQALRACRELAGDGRVLVVFGCGGDRDRAKRPLMGEIATRLADIAYVTSDNPRTEDPASILAEIEVGAERGSSPFHSIIDRKDAIAAALQEARAGDLVLVAGKGHEQGQQFADRTVPFDDIEVTLELLKGVTCPR